VAAAPEVTGERASSGAHRPAETESAKARKRMQASHLRLLKPEQASAAQTAEHRQELSSLECIAAWLARLSTVNRRAFLRPDTVCGKPCHPLGHIVTLSSK
jgi:hypothetical protein